MSPNPGTPPTGQRAVGAPRRSTRQFTFDPGADQPRRADPPPAEGEPDEKIELSPLHETIRVEMETGTAGKWICGLCEEAAEAGAAVSLRSAIWQGFGLPTVGSRVRLLVSPKRTQSFSIHAKVLPCADEGRPGTFTVRLAIDTNDPAALTQWRSAVDRARSS